MASLLQGTPLKATSYTTSSTETPKWMQDAIYNQVQLSQQAAAMPYQPYNLPTVAELSPLQKEAYAKVQGLQGAYDPAMVSAQEGLKDLSAYGTAGALSAAQGRYTQPSSVESNLSAGQGMYDQAAGLDVAAAANPYLQAAGRTAVQNVDQYMNPYQQNVMDVVARQGARNLSENLLPGVSDAFIKAGQFGSNRMGEFGSRALRDTQDSILNKQAELANTGYTQALGASQTDLARQGQLASTAGQVTSQQAQNLANIGQQYTTAGQTQQQYGINAAQAEQAAQASDYQRQQSALAQMASTAQDQQRMGYADTAALESAGASQQAQQQAGLNAAKSQFDEANMYPKTQLDWLNTQIRGMESSVPKTVNQTQNTIGASYNPSALSQIAGAYSTYKALTQP
jgi:hypothetical protein